MEVSTVIQKVVVGVDIHLSLEEAKELRNILGPRPATGFVYPLFGRLGDAIYEAEAKES